MRPARRRVLGRTLLSVLTPALAAVAVVACGARPSPTGPVPSGGPVGAGSAATVEVATRPPPRDPSCPASYAEVPAGQQCAPAPGAAATCAYAEGACACERTIPCSGVALTEESLASIPVRWRCTPTPPAVRADGCPGPEPSSGQVACEGEGRRCSYADCCTIEYRCHDRRWERSGGMCPP